MVLSAIIVSIRDAEQGAGTRPSRVGTIFPYIHLENGDRVSNCFCTVRIVNYHMELGRQYPSGLLQLNRAHGYVLQRPGDS